jgi:hypothetical protein
MKYLFVSGAPRSGTSALTELLSSHSKISIGMERFKSLYNKKKITKELFTEKMFFDFNTDQTNIGMEAGKYVEYYKKLKEKYKQSEIVGDKYPQLYKFWPALFDEFGIDGKYIFIIRDIEDVASSFNVRAQNPKDKWPIENDYRKAVEIWNQSLEKANNEVKKGQDIFIVSYSKLFDIEEFDSRDELKRMLDYLNLDVSSAMLEEYTQMCEKYIAVVKPKVKVVLSGQVDYIKTNANYELYNNLIK